jgi:diaminohydroxyphosphoribosylaminopyrimidine deaminase / 5-amino-6-(5-phosphoribosylamino)uracil reductase
VVATARYTPTWVVGSTAASAIAEEVLRGKGVEVIRADAPEGLFDLNAVMKLLAERGITRLMVEGGATVAANLVQADLVDEFFLLRGPNPIGENGVDALEGLPLSTLTQPQRMRSLGREMLGVDTLEHFVRS